MNRWPTYRTLDTSTVAYYSHDSWETFWGNGICQRRCDTVDAQYETKLLRKNGKSESRSLPATASLPDTACRI